ncbi:MAG TPA: hypothetical protein VFM84_05980, partial [Holophagaceae bacterium]|nr:hypothetical protein [Holophagaceae bacterium]
ALAHLDLDELRFVPTARSPHKPNEGEVTDAQRLALLEAALEGLDPRVHIEPVELERGGTSYTADTLETLSAREPGTAWILVLGSDQLPGLPRWRRAEAVFRLASIAVAERPGQDAGIPEGLPLRPVSAWSGQPGELVRLPSTESGISSSSLRDDLRHGRATAGLPAPVTRIIKSGNLYQ